MNTLHKIYEDQYYLNFLSDTDLNEINERLDTFSRENDLKDFPIFKSLAGHVARRIKYLSLKCSCRGLAAICFPETNPRHGVQMDGRDLKRWAAIYLNEAFSEEAKIAQGDYWHEY